MIRRIYIIRFIVFLIALVAFSSAGYAQKKSGSKSKTTTSAKSNKAKESVNVAVVEEQKKPLTVADFVKDARELQKLGDAEKSLTYLNQALEMASFEPTPNPEQIAEIINLQAMSYSMKFEWTKAIKLGQNAIRRLGKLQQSAIFPELFYSLASYYAGRGSKDDYEVALRYILRCRELVSGQSVDYFRCNNNMVFYYMMSNQHTQAMTIVEDAIRGGNRIFGKDKEAYIKELWRYASMFSEQDDYELATYYAKSCLNIMEQNGMTLTKEYVNRTINLAGFYYQKRDFLNEINTLTKIVDVAKEMDGDESTNYVNCLRKLALAYNHQAHEVRGKHSKEEYENCMQKNEYYEGLSREILIRTGNIYEIRSYQIPLISNQAHELFAEKKYADALRYEQIAYTLYKLEKDSVSIARTCNDIANFYYNSDQNLDSALTYSKLSVDMYDKIARNSRGKGLAYHNMGVYTHAKGNINEALDYQLKAINVFEQIGDTASTIYVNALGNAGVYNEETGNSELARYYSYRSSIAQERSIQRSKKEALAQISKLPRKKRKSAVLALNQKKEVNNNMVVVQWNKAMYAENASDIHDGYGKALSFQRELLIQILPDMDESSKKAEWDKQKYVTDYAENLAFSYSREDSLVIDAFNALILRDCMTEYLNNNDINTLKKDWHSVADSLDESTALVRFFLLPTSNKGDAYSAFVLCKGWTAPKIIRQLFTDSDLDILNYEPKGNFRSLFESQSGKALIASEGRFGRMIWNDIFAVFPSSIKSILYRSTGIGILDSFDPATYSIDEHKLPINNDYKLKKF